MNNQKYQMGKLMPSWKDGIAKTITFSITEDCNLACKYCYITGKNSKNKMNFDVAKDAVDYILSHREIFNEEAVVWEFIGGEPFLEIDLIDQISDYIKLQTYKLQHPWFDNYRFNFATNGLLYDTPKVQNYIMKNRNHVSIGISVDGNKIKHDLQRVYPDGRGSYEDVMKNVPLWQKQFPGYHTKATFSHEDLPHLKDSIISLWHAGIKSVAANCIFENVWHEGDDIILENQLKELGDYILENDMWEDYSVRFFDENIGFPNQKHDLEQNFCGAGKMLAVDYKGRLYPCIRFLDYSLNNRDGYCIGDVYTGINLDRIRPFLALTLESQSTEECINCEVARGCAWCQGHNYDESDTGTIYQRITYICKMHKANCRANEYFWTKFKEVTGIVSKWEETKNNAINDNDQYLQFILSDSITPACAYRNTKGTNNVMSKETLDKGIEFASKNGFTPVFLESKNQHIDVKHLEGMHIIDSSAPNIGSNILVVYDNTGEAQENTVDTCILLINRSNLSNLCSFVTQLSNSHCRINITLEEIESWNQQDIDTYKIQLGTLGAIVIDRIASGNPLEINILTDIFEQEKMSNCDAGCNTFSLAPNGKIYMCPAFYFDNPQNYIGTLDEGIEIKNKQLLELKNAPVCSSCDAYHCNRCKFLNKKLTSEFNTPSKIQCVISHLERNTSKKIQDELEKKGITFSNILGEINYLDPLEIITNKKYQKRSVANA